MVVVKKFCCPGAGPDCPNAGFEVVKSTEKDVKHGDYLLDADVENLADKVKVVVH